MKVVDAQIHRTSAALAGWDGKGDSAYRLATELALAGMEAAGVDAALIHYGDQGWPDFAAAKFPDRFASQVGVVPGGPLDPASPDIEEQVAELRQVPGRLAIRVLITLPPTGENVRRLKEGGFERLFTAAERHNVPAMVFVCGAPQLAGEIARDHPELRLIIDHLGLMHPPMKLDTPPFRRLPDVLSLAQYPNVAIKLSGAPALSTEAYPFDDLWPNLIRFVESFGADRLMWGSDIQRVRGQVAGLAHLFSPEDYVGKHTYAEAVGFIRDATQLSENEKELLLSGTLRRWLGWPDFKDPKDG